MIDVADRGEKACAVEEERKTVKPSLKVFSRKKQKLKKDVMDRCRFRVLCVSLVYAASVSDALDSLGSSASCAGRGLRRYMIYKFICVCICVCMHMCTAVTLACM
jgi:hypothetical protein